MLPCHELEPIEETAPPAIIQEIAAEREVLSKIRTLSRRERRNAVGPDLTCSRMSSRVLSRASSRATSRASSALSFRSRGAPSPDMADMQSLRNLSIAE